ncbi:MAG: 4Fe-4S binding protein [Tissierellaceae bacterium]|nr:4Fe-4S binding protein [Tissierellaceae bacterium]
METKKRIKKKAKVIKEACVACGTCIKTCPRNAITIIDGVFAEVDESKCIGCTICSKECPASIIKMISEEELIEYGK